MIVSSYHFAFGPLVALGALAVIVLICRWVFSTDDRDERTARRLAKARASGDFGLLVPVATVRVADDAEMLQGVLRGAGIRATIAAAPADGGQVVGGQVVGGQVVGGQVVNGQSGGWSVLVFRADAQRAQQLVRS